MVLKNVIFRNKNTIICEFYKHAIIDGKQREVVMFSKHFCKCFGLVPPNKSTWKKARAWSDRQVAFTEMYGR